MTTNARRGTFASVLAAGLLVGALPAVAAPSASRITQPYQHLVAAGEWGSAGTYVSHGGTIELKLNRVPRTVQAFVEGCSGGDLGKIRKYLAGEPRKQVLAKGVPVGTCFLVEFRDPTGEGGFVIKGKLSY